MVAVSVAHSGVAAVAPVSVAVTPRGSRAVTTPLTTSSSPSSTGLTKRTAAVPRAPRGAERRHEGLGHVGVDGHAGDEGAAEAVPPRGGIVVDLVLAGRGILRGHAI